jgi:hypothetical protein
VISCFGLAVEESFCHNSKVPAPKRSVDDEQEDKVVENRQVYLCDYFDGAGDDKVGVALSDDDAAEATRIALDEMGNRTADTSHLIPIACFWTNHWFHRRHESFLAKYQAQPCGRILKTLRLIYDVVEGLSYSKQK